MDIVKASSQRHFKGLVFGPIGAGKTRLLETSMQDVRTYPMLLLEYEGGQSSLVGSDIDIVHIRDWKDYDEAKAYLRSGRHPYKSIGIDSISESHVMSLLSQLDQRSRKVPDLLEQGDYGIALTQMRRLIRDFRDLPLHVFMTALAKDDVDPREGSVKKPALSGALADEAPGIFEVVGYLSTGVLDDGYLHRILVLQNYPKLRTKVRTPIDVVAPNEIVDPTVTSILDALQFPYLEEVELEPVAE